ncbi:MAG: nuclear transport factor 2 family protein [Acidimicrobiales bacterium]
MSESARPSPAWAARTGHVTLAPARPAGATEEALDRLLIAERIYRYGWAYDERNRDQLADCFTDDAVWEGSMMGLDAIGPMKGREAVMEFLTEFWAQQSDQRRHIFTNVIVEELSAAAAVAHAYLLLTASANDTMTPVTAGPYRLELVKQAGVWRLARLAGGFDAPF